MPMRPRGNKLPADVIGAAVKVMQIASSEETEELAPEQTVNPAAEMWRKGGKARAEAMTPERRAEIARKAAAKR